ncbi:hypothetical protein HDU97_002341 [Phlyctochytrium planicorne]|nr:hypothetical protein HDU97_002341 [Phlyctochytrium planicorne]
MDPIDEDVCQSGFAILNCLRAESGFSEIVTALLKLNTIASTAGFLTFTSTIRLRKLHSRLMLKNHPDPSISTQPRAAQCTNSNRKIRIWEVSTTDHESETLLRSDVCRHSATKKIGTGCERVAGAQRTEESESDGKGSGSVLDEYDVLECPVVAFGVEEKICFRASVRDFLVLARGLEYFTKIIIKAVHQRSQFCYHARHSSIRTYGTASLSLFSAILAHLHRPKIFSSTPGFLIPSITTLPIIPPIYLSIVTLGEAMDLVFHYFIDICAQTKDQKHAEWAMLSHTVSFYISASTITFIIIVTLIGSITLHKALKSADIYAPSINGGNMCLFPSKQSRRTVSPPKQDKPRCETRRKSITENGGGNNELQKTLLASTRLLNILIAGATVLMLLMLAFAFVPGTKTFQAAASVLGDFGSLVFAFSGGTIFLLFNNWRRLQYLTIKIYNQAPEVHSSASYEKRIYIEIPHKSENPLKLKSDTLLACMASADDDVCGSGYYILDCLRAESGFTEFVTGLLTLNTISTTLWFLTVASTIRFRRLQSERKQTDGRKQVISKSLPVGDAQYQFPMGISADQEKEISFASNCEEVEPSLQRLESKKRIRWSDLKAMEKVQIFAANPTILIPVLHLRFLSGLYMAAVISGEVMEIATHYYMDVYSHSKDPRHASIIKAIHAISFYISISTIAVLLLVTLTGTLMLQRSLASANANAVMRSNSFTISDANKEKSALLPFWKRGKPPGSLRQSKSFQNGPDGMGRKDDGAAREANEVLKKSLVSSIRLLNILFAAASTMTVVMASFYFVPGRKNFQAAANLLGDIGVLVIAFCGVSVFLLFNNWKRLQHLALSRHGPTGKNFN